MLPAREFSSPSKKYWPPRKLALKSSSEALRHRGWSSRKKIKLFNFFWGTKVRSFSPQGSLENSSNPPNPSATPPASSLPEVSNKPQGKPAPANTSKERDSASCQKGNLPAHPSFLPCEASMGRIGQFER